MQYKKDAIPPRMASFHQKTCFLNARTVRSCCIPRLFCKAADAAAFYKSPAKAAVCLLRPMRFFWAKLLRALPLTEIRQSFGFGSLGQVCVKAVLMQFAAFGVRRVGFRVARKRNVLID